MIDINLDIIVHINPTEANKIGIVRRPVDIFRQFHWKVPGKLQQGKPQGLWLVCPLTSTMCLLLSILPVRTALHYGFVYSMRDGETCFIVYAERVPR